MTFNSSMFYKEDKSLITFKVTHDVFAGLGVQTRADEREDGNLLHLLFVRCGGKFKT